MKISHLHNLVFAALVFAGAHTFSSFTIAHAQAAQPKKDTAVSADVLKDLAPTGKLRASINLGNIVLAQGTPAAPTGVTPELARELGKRLGVPVELTAFDAAGKAFEAMKAGKVDI